VTSNLKEELASLRIDHSARGGGSRRGAWIVIVLLVAAAATGGLYLYKREPVVEVKTVAAAARTGAAGAAGSILNASGYVTARRRATVSSKVTGKVVEVFVEEGKSVRKGQVLARLDDSQIRALLNVAAAQFAAAERGAAEDQARLREAELTLERRRQLVKEKVISPAELDTAEAQVESLKARIAMAEQQVRVAQTQVDARRTDLDDMVVRAPFDGVAISKDAQAGEMISPVSAGGGFTRTGICTIVDMSSLEVEVDVSENYINRVRAGQPVESVLDAYPDWRIPSHVITTVPSADRQKATVRVRIGFDELDPKILPDMGVKVSFLDEPAPPAADAAARPRMLVPKAAVRSSEGAPVVFVLAGERLERRAVKVGANNGDQVEIISGLNTGDRVVVDGPATLADRMRAKERE
jgi:RND family efflux transporter MFP subunit